ncbi:MAG: hypothetical protein ACTSPY_06370 [Candidatus Helarchaeota archaeon]
MGIYPVEGFLRSPLLILEGFILLLGFEYGAYFLKKYYKEEKEKNHLIQAWGFFFLFFAIMTFFFLISDYFITDYSIREIFLDLGYLSMGFGGLFFCYCLERELNYKKPIFSVILFILLIVLIINMFVLFMDSTNIVVICWVPFVILLTIYIYKLTEELKGQKKWKIVSFIGGFFVYLIAYILISDYIVEIFGLIVRMFGNILIIIGLSLISIILIELPRIELAWREKIRSVLIIHKSGTCISVYNFHEEKIELENNDRNQLIAGGLIGIVQMLEDIIESKDKEKIHKKIEIMDHKDVKIIFNYGNHLTAVIIVDEILNIYKFKLKKLTHYLEFLYADILPNFKPEDIFQFKTVKGIIKRFFE